MLDTVPGKRPSRIEPGCECELQRRFARWIRSVHAGIAASRGGGPHSGAAKFLIENAGMDKGTLSKLLNGKEFPNTTLSSLQDFIDGLMPDVPLSQALLEIFGEDEDD